MTIKEVTSQEGFWKVHAEDSFNYLHQGGTTDESANRVYEKVADTSFVFHRGIFLHYSKLFSSEVCLAQHYFQIDETAEFISTYKDKHCEGSPILNFHMKSFDNSRIIFHLLSDDIYFVCDYVADKNKLQKMLEVVNPANFVDDSDIDLGVEDDFSFDDFDLGDSSDFYQKYLTSGVWKVNSERSFDNLIKQTKQNNPDLAQTYLDNREDMLAPMQGMVLFFNEHDNSFRISSPMLVHEGFFNFSGSLYVNLYESEETKDNGELLSIYEVNDDVFCFGYRDSIYYADKMRKL